MRIGIAIFIISIFAGCGSEDFLPKTKKINVKPGKKQTKYRKNIIVTDDYVLRAKVTDSHGRAAMELNKKGSYEFNFVPIRFIKSSGGFVDMNSNGKKDKDEPDAFTMYADIDKKYINPFTTISFKTNFKDSYIAKIFGLRDININTTSNNIKLRKSVAYANAILGISAIKEYKISRSQTRSNTNTIQMTMDDLVSNMKKHTLSHSIAKITNKQIYNDIEKSNDLAFINRSIKHEYNYFNSNSRDNSTCGNTSISEIGCDANKTTSESNATKPSPIVPINPPNKPNKTRDGWNIVKLNHLRPIIPISAKYVRIDRVAFFQRTKTDGIYIYFKEPGFTNKKFPPNPPAFPSELIGEIQNNEIVLNLTKVDRRGVDSFNFKPEFIEYKD